MANIKERNGSYLITVSNGRDLEGNQIRKHMTYIPKATSPKAIEKEVEQVAQEFENRVKNGSYYDGENMTFSELYQIWKENYLDRSDLTPYVKEDYEYKATHKFLPRLGNMKISKIKALHIDEILNDLFDSGLATSTIKKHYTVINQIMAYAYKKELIRENPCDRVDLPKKKETATPLRYFTPDQARRFLEFLDQDYPLNCPTRTRTDSNGNQYTVRPYSTNQSVPVMLKAYFYLAIYGGLRRGEICGLTWEDIDFEDHTVSINKAIGETRNSGQIVKDPKTVKSVRKISVPTIVLQIFNQWKIEETSLALKLGSQWTGYRGKDFDKNFIFIDRNDGSMMNLHTPSKRFKGIIKRYNETVDEEDLKLPNIRLHDLRHTSATLLLANGSDIETVSKRLGHSKASITLDVYGHALETMDRKASDILESALSQNA